MEFLLLGYFLIGVVLSMLIFTGYHDDPGRVPNATPTHVTFACVVVLLLWPVALAATGVLAWQRRL